MKWADTFYDRVKTKEVWHEWFAWHRVRVGDQFVWLEMIERKGKYIPPGQGCGYFFVWEYRTLDPRTIPLGLQ